MCEVHYTRNTTMFIICSDHRFHEVSATIMTLTLSEDDNNVCR